MSQSHRVHRILFAAVVGTLLPLGTAHALDILGNKFAEPMMSGTGSDVDVSSYGRIYILGNTFWLPGKEGSEY